MTKLPEGRKPLPDEWFVDRAKTVQPNSKKGNTMNTVPTYKCKQVDNQLVFYCPKCKKEHYHSLGDGHRVAHCLDVNAHPEGYNVYS